MLVREVIDIIENVAPLSQQEPWDNSGLQIGQREATVSSALLCTDITDDIIEEGISKGCEMIISHHPLLFHGLKHLTGETLPERCAIKAIRHHIAIYSAHTSMDNYLHGVSGKMAEKLGIKDYSILVGKDGIGLGVIGNLAQATTFDHLLKQVKIAFNTPVIRYVLGSKNDIQRIALCGGAGAEFMEDAIAQGADVYISADFKYHEFLQSDGRIGIMDIGHFESEQYTKEIFKELLENQGIKLYLAEKDKSPIQAY